VKTYLLLLVSVASWQLGSEQGPSGSTGRWVYIPCLVVENSVLYSEVNRNYLGVRVPPSPRHLSVILCSVLTPAATRRRPRDTTGCWQRRQDPASSSTKEKTHDCPQIHPPLHAVSKSGGKYPASPGRSGGRNPAPNRATGGTIRSGARGAADSAPDRAVESRDQARIGGSRVGG